MPEVFDIADRRPSEYELHSGFQGVRFLSLELEGFGIYAQPIRFTFPPLVGIDIRPNEKGKSTLVQGLQAVLFGLPNNSDSDKFGTARFRSWERSRAFSGALDLLIDGRRYRILRDFDTHLTRILSLDYGEAVLYQGEANPKGHTSSIHRYRQVLAELIPVTDPELFQAVYCVEQPLPP
jgi:hypothetical protein